MKTNEEKVIFAGFGGQGVMLMGQMLAYVATAKELHTVWIPSYGPETRGGTANCSVTIAKQMINSPIITEADSAVVLNLPSLQKFEPRLKKNGLLIVNNNAIEDYTYRTDIRVLLLDANRMALKLGNLKVANMIMLGAYLEATAIFPKEALFEIFKKTFTGSKEKLLDLNYQAVELGMETVRAQV